MEKPPQDSDSSSESKADIKVELLQFTNAQIHVVKEEIREMLRLDVKTYKEEIKGQNWRAIKIGLVVLGFFVGASLLNFYRGYRWVQNKGEEVLKTETESIRETVSKRLDQEFETKRIRTLIEEKAKEYTEKRAQVYITETVEKSIKPLSAKMQNDIKSFDSYLKDTREKIIKEYSTLSTEVNLLKELNRLSSLGAQAIAEGDSRAFRELGIYSGDPKKQAFKKFVLAEIYKVKSFYISVTRIAGVNITYTVADGTEKTDEQIPTHLLIEEALKQAKWEFRAKAAELLGRRSEKGVPEALIESFDDGRLDVAKIALDSFVIITGYKKIDVFDFTRAKEWYKKNAPEVEKKLKTPDSAK
jgi:hypothetical protein